jgi:hypothetical protein
MSFSALNADWMAKVYSGDTEWIQLNFQRQVTIMNLHEICKSFLTVLIA